MRPLGQKSHKPRSLGGKQHHHHIRALGHKLAHHAHEGMHHGYKTAVSVAHHFDTGHHKETGHVEAPLGR
jgi:hypothetical protein